MAKPIQAGEDLLPDGEHHSSVEINGADNQRAMPARSVPLASSRLVGPNGQETGSHNKIVIKSRRSVVAVNDSGCQDQPQCVAGNEPLSGNDVEDIQRLYERNPEAFRQWLQQKAPSDLLSRLRHLDTSSKQFASSDLFHRWIAFSPTKVSDCLRFYVVVWLRSVSERKIL